MRMVEGRGGVVGVLLAGLTFPLGHRHSNVKLNSDQVTNHPVSLMGPHL